MSVVLTVLLLVCVCVCLSVYSKQGMKEHLRTESIPMYVITLFEARKGKERRYIFRKRFRGFDYSFFPGVYGKQLKENDIDVCAIGRNQELNPGQKGCLLSHIRLWKEIQANGSKYAIIMEDDAILSDRFSEEKLFEYASKVDFDMIFLGHTEEEKGRRVAGDLYESVYPRGMFGYLVSRRGIEKLNAWIDGCPRLEMPIDEALAYEIWRGRFESFSVFPPIVKVDGKLESTINE